MTATEKKILIAIQHLITTARFKAYHDESSECIAELLDKADHVCNLAMEPDSDTTRVQRAFNEILEKYPECSSSLLSVE